MKSVMRIMAVYGYITIFACGVIVVGNIGHQGEAMSRTANAVCLLLVASLVYFFPTIVAWARRQPQTLAILCANLFLGWPFLGWVAALVWACMNTTKAQTAAA
jgi:Superinfection immunity protein